jgi:hypothetical protein
VNHQEVGAFIKTVYRADFYTVCVLALNAVVTNNKGHLLPLLSVSGHSRRGIIAGRVLL